MSKEVNRNNSDLTNLIITKKVFRSNQKQSFIGTKR